jgi:hypothetical protein
MITPGCNSYDSNGDYSMPKTVVIRGDGGKVQIEVLNYERPKTPEGSDANWLVCKCGVAVEGVKGTA